MNSWTSYVARISSERDGLTREHAEVVRKGYEYAAELLGFVLPELDERHRELVDQRFLLRKNKSFAEADKIRENLWNENLVLIDHRDHTVWFKSSIPNAARRMVKLDRSAFKPKT